MPSKLKAFIPTQRGLCEKVTWISAFSQANVMKSYRGRFKWQVRNIFTWRHIAPSYGQWMAEMKSTCFPPLNAPGIIRRLFVAHVLSLPLSKVVCKTERIGGGFGGKEARSAFLAAVASVPSYLLNRPVKITLNRDVDMKISGQRHSSKTEERKF